MKPAVAAARPPKRCTDCALRVQTCFTQVSATDLTWIETFRSGTRAVPAGQSVFAEQSKISQLFTVYSGWAFRYKTLADGSPRSSIFCWPAIWSACRPNLPTRPRTASRH